MNTQLLLSIIESIKAVKGQYPGKKELQKTVYLLQKKGLPSDYSYRFHFFGPYSDALDEDIQRLAIRGLLEVRHDNNTHRIALSDFSHSHCDKPEIEDDLMQDELLELKTISPMHLELMATILFLLDNDMVSPHASEDDVVAKVHEVKKGKYKDAEILQFYHQLKKGAYTR